MTTSDGVVLEVSVVVPVYNSDATLHELADRVFRALAGHDVELILVNDASQDQSWSRIEELARADERVRGIDLMRNYGQHNALLAGVRVASKAVIVTIDDDLQNPPEEILKLLYALGHDHDVVYGTSSHTSHGLWRGLAARVTKMTLQSAMGSETARKVSPFRAFRTQVREGFSGYHGPLVSIDVLLTWATTRFAAVEVRHDPRKVGTSNYTLRMLVTHSLNMTTGFSVRPLQMASVTGFGFALFGLAVLAYVIVRYVIAGGSVPGFPFLASIIAVFAGAQLFALGIIGEYLARMHFRLMQKPTFVEKRRTTARSDPE